MTSAMPRAERFSEPAKITSSDLRSRRALPCSPRAQRSASARLLLPEPLGPDHGADPGAEFDDRPLAERLETLQAQGQQAGGRGHRASASSPGSSSSLRSISIHGSVTDSTGAPRVAPLGRSSSSSSVPNSSSSGASSVDSVSSPCLGPQELDGPRRRLGFGDAAGVAVPDSDDPSGHNHLDPKDLVVVRAYGVEQVILRSFAGEPLRELLEPALGTLERAERAIAGELGRGQRDDELGGDRRTPDRGRRRPPGPRRPRRGEPACAGHRAAIRLRPAADSSPSVEATGQPARPAVLTIEARRADRTPSSSSG